jgi:hypothetical protein
MLGLDREIYIMLGSTWQENEPDISYRSQIPEGAQRKVYAEDVRGHVENRELE